MHKQRIRPQRFTALSKWLSRMTLRLLGWRWEGGAPAVDKCVIVGAPHTSNWDLPFALLGMRALDIPAAWMMKDTVFFWPLGLLWRWLGGIPVNRRQRSSAVAQMVQAFNENEQLLLILSPEGTRKNVKHWKTGFYWMAVGAGAYIVPGLLSYEKKLMKTGPLIKPTGDLEADFQKIREYFQEVAGVTPEYDHGEAAAHAHHPAA